MLTRLFIYLLRKPQVAEVIREIVHPSSKTEGWSPEEIRAIQEVVFGTSQ